MGRVILILLAAIAVAIALMLIASALRDAQRSIQGGNTALTEETGQFMGPTTLKKLAYVALIVVLFGVTSGWLGGV